jgi:hypothetical protein
VFGPVGHLAEALADVEGRRVGAGDDDGEHQSANSE